MKKLTLIISIFALSLVNLARAEVDPFEEFNRGVFTFNESLDNTVFEPTARAYRDHMPEFVQDRVHDFFSNLGDVSTLANQILQFKAEDSVTTFSRVVINTTVGLAGLFDVASDMGMEQTDEDFGQTLAVWGVGDGPYIMLPILGPSTLRDTAGFYVDSTANTSFNAHLDGGEQTAATLTNALDIRTELLPVTDLLDSADDPYIAMRSSYLQKRKNDIYDGNVPVSDDDF